MGIQVSEVETAEEARAIVRLAKYPPIGNRGISGQGPHTGYKSYGARHATEYAPWANENIIICPSIELLAGLENVEEIAAVEGIDMIAYGHSDLSAQLGVHLDLEESEARADELVAADDYNGVAVWRRIRDAVAQRTNKTPPGPVH